MHRASAHAASGSACRHPLGPAENWLDPPAIISCGESGQSAQLWLGVAARCGWATCRSKVVRQSCGCAHKPLMQHDLLDRSADAHRRHTELLPRLGLGKGRISGPAWRGACHLSEGVPADCCCESQPCAERGGASFGSPPPPLWLVQRPCPLTAAASLRIVGSRLPRRRRRRGGPRAIGAAPRPARSV